MTRQVSRVAGLLVTMLIALAVTTAASPATGAPACAGESNWTGFDGLVRQAHPVVLVHGWTGNVMSDLRTRLERTARDGWQYLLFDYHAASTQGPRPRMLPGVWPSTWCGSPMPTALPAGTASSTSSLTRWAGWRPGSPPQTRGWQDDSAAWSRSPRRTVDLRGVARNSARSSTALIDQVPASEFPLAGRYPTPPPGACAWSTGISGRGTPPSCPQLLGSVGQPPVWIDRQHHGPILGRAAAGGAGDLYPDREHAACQVAAGPHRVLPSGASSWGGWGSFGSPISSGGARVPAWPGPRYSTPVTWRTNAAKVGMVNRRTP